jgi:hypothetical protein
MTSRAACCRFLGLSSNAPGAAIQARCAALLGWLESDEIPDDLRPWADHQAALVEECHDALVGLPAESDTSLLAGRLGTREPVAVRSSAPGGLRSRLGRPLGLLVAGVVAGLAVAGGALLAAPGAIARSPGQAAGAGTSQPAPRSTGGAPAVDTARVRQLEAADAAHPGDATVLFELGETYMHAEQWQPAVEWFGRLLRLDPASVPSEVDLLHAQIDVGIAYLNLGRPELAEPILLQLADRQPGNPQIHFTLGFLFAGGAAPNREAAARHWEETVRLAPDSQWGAAARVHLDGLRTRAQGGAP